MALFDEILAETKRTKAASRLLAKLPSVVKNRALLQMADDLISSSDFLVKMQKISKLEKRKA